MRICFINNAGPVRGSLANGLLRFFGKNRPNTPLFGQILQKAVMLALIVFSGKMIAQPNGCTPTCRDTIHVNMLANAPCTAPIIEAADILTTATCLGNYSLQMFSQSMAAQINQPLVGGFYVGSWRWAKAIYTPNDNSCMTKVYFFDKTPPVLTCKDTLISCNVPLDTATLGRPTVADNCSPNFYLLSKLGYSDQITDIGACTDDFIQKINRLWITVDQSGNPATCIQKITIKRPVLQTDVEFPLDKDIVACSQDKNNLALTGQPIINGRPINVPACGFSVQKTDYIMSTCSTTDTTWERHWLVILPDPCTGQPDSLLGLQVITMMDTLKPVLNCPGNTTVSFLTDECFADVKLPTVFGQDACAGSIQAIPSWYYGSGTGVFTNVQGGTYTVTYMAMDCNNESTCQMLVTVNDQQPPTIECRTKVQVMLDMSGHASAPANVFLKSWSDNCATDFIFEINKGSGFTQNLDVSCADLGTILATVRVSELGNPASFSECQVEILVMDKFKPQITCPANLTVSCDNANLYNLTAFGGPVITENCSLDTVIYSEKKEVSACGTGFALRKWIAIDLAGNKDSCTQNITVINNKPFSAANIIWPKDTVFFNCVASLDPSAFPAAYKEPVFTGVFCGMPVFSKTDAVYDGGKPACWKIVRKWKVIDWCSYNPATDAPKFEYYQTIAVMDSIKPLMHLPADATVSFGNTCTTGAVTASATATDCSTKLTWQQLLLNGTKNPYSANPNSPDLSGNYPAGTTTIKVICSDGCGNDAVGLWKVTVKDLKPPTPLCMNGLSVSLNKMGDNIFMAMIAASQFNQGSSDNCTAPGNLKYTVRKAAPGLTTPATETSIAFDCNDLGTQIIELWVTDEAGNSDFCTTYIIVQDNKKYCPLVITAQISGSIVTDMGDVLENATIELMNNNAVLPVPTSALGAFALQNLAVGNDYAVHPKKNDDPTNGISTFDLIAIQKHVLGLVPFTSPFQFIAGDINKNGSVSTFDMVELRKLVLGVYSDFPQNSSWRFVETGFQFPDPANPLATVFPEMKMVPLTATGATANFTAIKIGDLNHTATANSGFNGDASDRGDDPELAFFFDEKTWKTGEIMDLQLRAKDFKQVEGMQFTLKFDPNLLAFDDIFSENLPGFSTQNVGAFRLDDGLLTFSWNSNSAKNEGLNLDENTPVFTLRMRGVRPGTLSESVKMSSEITAAEAWSIGDKRKKPTLAFSQKDGSVTTGPASPEGNELLQNRPNPFSDQTAISFQLAENQEVTVKIFDLSGRLVFTETADAPAGMNEFWVSKSSLPGPGVYVYRLESATWQASKKLIVE